MRGVVIYFNFIDYPPRQQRFQRPGHVLRRDAVHRGTHAEVGREQLDVFVGKAFDQTVDQVYFCADGPF